MDLKKELPSKIDLQIVTSKALTYSDEDVINEIKTVANQGEYGLTLDGKISKDLYNELKRKCYDVEMYHQKTTISWHP